MKFLGQTFLDGTTLFEVVVVWVTRVLIRMCVSFHGHDSSSATQLVVVLDGDDGLFGDTVDGCINIVFDRFRVQGCE